jgi:hypothetical protein
MFWTTMTATATTTNSRRQKEHNNFSFRIPQISESPSSLVSLRKKGSFHNKILG